MSPKTRNQRTLVVLLSLACVLGLVLASGMWWLLRMSSATTMTAYFDKAIGLYAGSAVRVVGIEVGKVTEVRPMGGKVQAQLSVESGVTIPTGAKAVVIAPSLVSDRYVQLTPAYTGGPKMRSGAVIPRSRTATPVEIDDLYNSANKLATALGPNGVNKHGALSRLLDTASANLAGNGANLNKTVKKLSDAAAALTHSKGDIFATVDNLQKFTNALAASDGQVRDFEGKLADVSGFLSNHRQDLGTALQALGDALGRVKSFVHDNASKIESNVGKLTGVTKTLADQRSALAEILDVAPLGVTNYINGYDQASGSVAVRGDLNELSYPPIMFLCNMIKAGKPKGVPQNLSDICGKLAPVLDGTLKLPSVTQVLNALEQGKLPSLPAPLGSVLAGQSGGAK